MLSAPLCQNLGYDNVHKACPPISGMSGIPLKFHIHVFTMIIKIDFFFKGEQMTKQHSTVIMSHMFRGFNLQRH